jgi:hypothetical protein
MSNGFGGVEFERGTSLVSETPETRQHFFYFFLRFFLLPGSLDRNNAWSKTPRFHNGSPFSVHEAPQARKTVAPGVSPGFRYSF